jgi:hypothetical protein
MVRKRLVASVLLALGTSATAVVAADPPMPEPAPVATPTPPVGRPIKIEIGFEPWPLEESAAPAPAPSPDPPMPAPIPAPAAPMAAPAVMPVSTAAPAPAMPPAPSGPLASADSAKPGALTLAAAERMALTHAMAQRAAGSLVMPTSLAEDMENHGAGFVDQAVLSPTTTTAGGKPMPVSATQAQVLAQRYRLLNNVRLRYYHLLALQRLVAVRQDLAGVSRDAVTAIEAMANSGQATKAELLQARMEAREQMAALQSARAVQQAVWAHMAAIVGNPDLPVGPLAGDLEQSCLIPALDAAWVHVREASPELQAVRGELARRQTAVRQTLNGSTGKAGDKSQSDGFMSQAVAMVGGSFGNHEPQIKQATWTELSKWEAEVTRVEQSLKQRLTDAYARCDQARDVAELYRSQNLPDAKESFELSVMSYRRGQGSWPQVQISQRNYFRMSTEYVEALAELRKSELVILGLLLDVPDETPAQPVVQQAAHR